MIGIKPVLMLSSIIFAIGIYGVLSRRNAIGILMAIELIFNSACLNFVVFTRYLYPNFLTGNIFVLFIIAIAAGEVAVALALFVGIYRQYKNIDADKISTMRG